MKVYEAQNSKKKKKKNQSGRYFLKYGTYFLSESN